MAMFDGRNGMEEITDKQTRAELELNARNRANALEPVVNELKALNLKTEEMVKLLCEIVKRAQQ
jgi:hypothetical protein